MGWKLKASSAEGCLERLSTLVCFLLMLFTTPRPRKTGRVLRKVSLSRLENLFFELEFSSIFLDGEIGTILVFLLGEPFEVMDEVYYKKLEHLRSNRPLYYYWLSISFYSWLDARASCEFLVTKIFGTTPYFGGVLVSSSFHIMLCDRLDEDVLMYCI